MPQSQLCLWRWPHTPCPFPGTMAGWVFLACFLVPESPGHTPLPAEANPPSSTAAVGVLPVWAGAGSSGGQAGVVGIKSPPSMSPLTPTPSSSPWHHFTTVRVTYSYLFLFFLFLQRCRRHLSLFKSTIGHEGNKTLEDLFMSTVSSQIYKTEM